MIIDCISDLHGSFPPLSGGDLLILAGDYTLQDTIPEWIGFFRWLNQQPYRKKVLIAGNHDGFFCDGFPKSQKEADELKEVQSFLSDSNEIEKEDFEYLCDSGCEFEGLKIWGSPWTPTFCNWCFMKDRGEPIKEMWDLIPSGTDILITHGPPFGILDQVSLSSRGQGKDRRAGCVDLRNAVERIQPRLHVFGHIHEGYGQTTLKCTPGDVLCVNASIMDLDYNPVNQPIRIIL